MTIDRVNHLNSGLMVASLAAAIALPFEVFLASYAVLGPLHYLTEISWLHDRDYFVPSKWLALPVAALTGAALLSSGFLPDALTFPALSAWNAEAVLLALGLALVFVVARSGRTRALGAAAVTLGVVAAHFADEAVRAADLAPQTLYDIFLTVFLTTVVHVFVFTGAFVLHGALKSRSRSGLVSFAVFLACAATCFAVPVHALPAVSQATREAWAATSETVSAQLQFYGGGQRPIPSIADAVYASPTGVMVARFIAWAYTYHYLNWFSKTSVIRWHEVPRARLLAVVAIAIVSVALYAVDYGLGLRWLFLLSLLHVFLEFPLNWRSFFGIGAELSRRLRPA